MIERTEEDGVLLLRLAHGKANALDTELCRALEQALAEARHGAARAAVVTGTGGIFSAGVDLVRLVEGGGAYLDGFLPALKALFESAFTFPKPLVAAVNGHAVAGGGVLAFCADRRLMATGDGTLGVPELRVGVPFPTLALEVVRLAVPAAALGDLILRGARLGCEEALARGMVDEVVEPEHLVERAMAAARELAEVPAEVYALTKEQLRAPALARVRAAEAEREPRVEALWRSASVLEAVRGYVRRTLGR